VAVLIRTTRPQRNSLCARISWEGCGCFGVEVGGTGEARGAAGAMRKGYHREGLTRGSGEKRADEVLVLFRSF
jgi:hypothetical protein